MSLQLLTSGHFVSEEGGGTAPVLSNVTPSENTTPGNPGGFSNVYSVARVTPIEFDITGIPAGTSITMTAKLAGQQATYQVLNTDGDFLWPFDDGGSTIGGPSEPVHVVLLPRGGWPPGMSDIEVAASFAATE